MVFPSLVLLFASVVIGVGAGPVEKKFKLERRSDGFPYPLDEVDKLEMDSLSKFEKYLTKNSTKVASNSTCTLENAVRRYEWSDLSVPQREEYIRAVLCLQSKPPKAPKAKFPGAMNRYDDYVATHESQAFHLHSTPHFFAAHRLYIWAYEKALREECGYTGYQPYWNWGRYAADPINSPLFNGNASSMGGNGGPATYPGIDQGGAYKKPYDRIPPAGGGGCVTEGPFKNMTVSLGPIGGVLKDVPKNPQSDGYGANPRCLRRDVNKYSAAVTFANYTYALITGAKDVDTFQNNMLGMPEKNDWGVHTGGHYTIGGDPGGDFYSSPGDPVFWFHHAMVDRVWWIWQMQDPDNRMDKFPGVAPADDVVDLEFTAPRAKLTDLLNNVGGFNGQFCYIYV